MSVPSPPLGSSPLVFSGERGRVVLPHRLEQETMYALIAEAVDEKGKPKHAVTEFSFERMTWIDPTGVVALSSLIDYLAKNGSMPGFVKVNPTSDCVRYLDDSGFFKQYSGQDIRPEAKCRRSTVRLERVPIERMVPYLGFDLVPWIANRVGLEPESIDSVKASLEEIFNNVYDHAGVQRGCVFAQFFPNLNRIQVAISDPGAGIPTVVRRKLPTFTDEQALVKACEKGFTTQSNVRNRGVGLDNLIRFVTRVNGGSVQLVSGRAELAAMPSNTGDRRRVRRGRYPYPGTLVKVILRTDTFEALEADVQKEDFKW